MIRCPFRAVILYRQSINGKCDGWISSLTHGDINVIRASKRPAIREGIKRESDVEPALRGLVEIAAGVGYGRTSHASSTVDLSGISVEGVEVRHSQQGL